MIVRVTPRPRIVADDAAVAPALESIGRPVLLFVADGRLAEIDAPVRRDVDIVGESETGIVDHREPAPVRLVRQLRHRLVGRDRIEPHAADADEQVALAVKGHAKRVTADMSKDLVARMIGAEEADDVAVAGAAIEIVVAVQNDVLGPFDLAKSDHLDGPQLVVQRVRRGRIEGGRRRGKREIGGGHIDLRQPPVAIAQEAHVDEDGGDQHATQNRRVDRPGHAEACKAVGHDEDQQGAHDRLGDGPSAPAKRIAAEHRRGESGHFQPYARVGACAADARGEEEACERAQD